MAAHPKHDAVRGRYHGRCGYCGVSEEDAGGEFTDANRHGYDRRRSRLWSSCCQ